MTGGEGTTASSTPRPPELSPSPSAHLSRVILATHSPRGLLMFPGNSYTPRMRSSEVNGVSAQLASRSSTSGPHAVPTRSMTTPLLQTLWLKLHINPQVPSSPFLWAGSRLAHKKRPCLRGWRGLGEGSSVGRVLAPNAWVQPSTKSTGHGRVCLQSQHTHGCRGIRIGSSSAMQ